MTLLTDLQRHNLFRLQNTDEGFALQQLCLPLGTKITYRLKPIAKMIRTVIIKPSILYLSPNRIECKMPFHTIRKWGLMMLRQCELLIQVLTNLN